jgi:hypothetical protein|tara:strand:- start:7 stop:201 length:195 start_codon:yes stop_codon:yes gene_type:complete
MAKQYKKLVELYCADNGVNSVEFNPMTNKADVELCDDGDGVVYISAWNLSIKKPSNKDLAKYDD